MQLVAGRQQGDQAFGQSPRLDFQVVGQVASVAGDEELAAEVGHAGRIDARHRAPPPLVGPFAAGPGSRPPRLRACRRRRAPDRAQHRRPDKSPGMPFNFTSSGPFSGSTSLANCGAKPSATTRTLKSRSGARLETRNLPSASVAAFFPQSR